MIGNQWKRLVLSQVAHMESIYHVLLASSFMADVCHRYLPRVYSKVRWEVFQFLRSCRNVRKMTALSVLHKFWSEYAKNTPKKLKIIDAYLLYVFLTGVTQFVYCCLVGTFPFNSFLSGFISCVSCFILGGNYNFTSTLHMHYFIIYRSWVPIDFINW